MFSEKLLEIWLRKQIPWFVQTCIRRESSPPLAIPGTPVSQEKPFGSPMAALTPTWALCSVAKASVQTAQCQKFSSAQVRTYLNLRLLLVLKFSISSNFIFLQDTCVEFLKVALKHP